MKKMCSYCGNIFETEREDKIYCNKNCSRAARATHDESWYKFPKEVELPLRSFECAYCGKHVDVYSSLDQRHVYCCYKHYVMYKELKRQFSKGRKGSNIGMSGGMSLGSLIRRENRDLD